MIEKSTPPMTVYFDGGCPVCSREIGFYRRLDREGAIRWHDVSAGVGDLAGDGVTQEEALARFHARLPGGRLVTGVDAFIALWRRLPWFRRLAPIAAWRPIRFILERGYAWYAPRRLRLTGRRNACQAEACATAGEDRLGMSTRR